MDTLDPGFVKNLLIVEYVEHDHKLRLCKDNQAIAEEIGCLECIERIYRSLFDADVLEEIEANKERKKNG